MLIRELPDGIAVMVKVQPRSSRNQIVRTDDVIKVYLNAPPVDGAANQACIELFAAIMHLPKTRISLLSGQKSRNKVIKLQGISKDRFLAETQGDVDKN